MTATKLTLTFGAAALLLAACSSPATGGQATAGHAATHSAAAKPSAAAAHRAAAANGPMTGTWKGQYGGSYQGTFVLHWRQSGSKLAGHINIPSLSRHVPIHGTVNGGSIQFGTVGSQAITYSGTVAGNSMSGTYRVGGTQGGNWHASKS